MLRLDAQFCAPFSTAARSKGESCRGNAMTPREAGNLLGYLTGQVIVLALIWLVVVAITVIVGKLLRRRVSVRDATRSVWALAITANTRSLETHRTRFPELPQALNDVVQ
jgi:hypothetical protein